MSEFIAEVERRWHTSQTSRPGPAQPQPHRARQAKLVICD